jgi:uncharacterized protein involved in exopolysaccharide biosynthesis
LFSIVFFLTKNEPKTYNSDSTVYTGIATGSSIVSLEESKFDLFGTRAAFDNLINIIKSRATAEEVGLRLFASHLLLDEPSDEIISRESYANFVKIVPEEVRALAVKGDFEKTYQRLIAYKEKDHHNFVYGLVHLNHPHYSASKILAKYRVRQIQSSDMINISYSSDDPGICYNTLRLINEVFVESYSNIKVNQSDAVVKYFQGQLDNASVKLSDAENELLAFNEANNIINYYEQTKHIASEKEHFDLEFQRIKREQAAAKSVLVVLENKLDSKQKTKVNSREIIEARNRLADLSLEIAVKTYNAELDSAAEAQLLYEISTLQIQKYELEEQLKSAVEQKFFIDNSIDGVPSLVIVEDWLDKVIELESLNAEIIVSTQRDLEFKDLFRVYAPLGATMKRLERKIDVAEREYLSLLNSLNLAKLKQQNVELNSNIKEAEPPFFPIESQPSKRKFLLLIALMLGFIFPAFTIIVLEFLDTNIKNARRAEEFSGLEVAAIYPNLHLRNKRIDIDHLSTRAIDLISQKLILQTRKDTSNEPNICIVSSNMCGEGKTLVMQGVLERLAEIGYKSLFITNGTIEEPKNFDYCKYEIDNNFQRVETIDELNFNQKGISFKNYNYIVVELPGIVNISIPSKILVEADQLFWIVRANRAWGKAETYALKDILKITEKQKPQLILNGVEADEMENVLGDLPKKRSFFRRAIKKIIRLQFFSKSKFKKGRATS